jgi:hypothetical protein
LCRGPRPLQIGHELSDPDAQAPPASRDHPEVWPAQARRQYVAVSARS